MALDPKGQEKDSSLIQEWEQFDVQSIMRFNDLARGRVNDNPSRDCG